MNAPDRLRRRRCIGLRVGVLFAILLIVFDWGAWAPVGVAAAAGLVAAGAYWRDCRSSVTRSARADTHTRDE